MVWTYVYGEQMIQELNKCFFGAQSEEEEANVKMAK